MDRRQVSCDAVDEVGWHRRRRRLRGSALITCSANLFRGGGSGPNLAGRCGLWIVLSQSLIVRLIKKVPYIFEFEISNFNVSWVKYDSWRHLDRGIVSLFYSS